YPEAVRAIPTFGSWYAPDLNRVINARPDLVFTFGRHHDEMASALMEAGLQVYHCDPGTVAESLATFRDMAWLMDRKGAGEVLIAILERRLEWVAQRVAGAERISVLRIMNWNPLITIGPGSFQHDVINLAGGRNVMSDGLQPYFVCSPEMVQQRNPEAIFFCEPFIKEILEKDPEWQKVSAVRNGRIYIFDCGLTCRSGPRIVDMVEELAEVLHNVSSAAQKRP
ncbi:MAG: ABC transporter substrate-binding protein, partial [Acidobacteriota bacterium]